MVFHYSEDGGIEEFAPRAPRGHPGTPPRVWAIDEWHSPLYLFPADCPRVAWWPLPATTDADRERWMPAWPARMVICIEQAWLERWRATTLYQYAFDPAPFVDCRDHGVYVAAQRVAPLARETLTDLPRRLAEAGVEVRILPRLGPMVEPLFQSTLHASTIRMRNAQDWSGPLGTPTLDV